MSARRLAVVAALAACSPSASDRLARGPSGQTDRQIQEACTVTVRACSRCHDLGKVMVTRLDSSQAWRQLVLRMRRLPGSGITDAEVHAAERCLVFHDLGPRGLDELAALGGPS